MRKQKKNMVQTEIHPITSVCSAGEKVEDIVEGAVGKVMGGGKKETEKSGGGLDSLMSLAGGGGNKEEKSGGGLDSLMSLAGGGGDKNEDKSGGGLDFLLSLFVNDFITAQSR